MSDIVIAGLFIVLFLIGLWCGFRAGHSWTLAAIRRGAKWSMTYPELVEFDRLMGKALAKRGKQE